MASSEVVDGKQLGISEYEQTTAKSVTRRRSSGPRSIKRFHNCPVSIRLMAALYQLFVTHFG